MWFLRLNGYDWICVGLTYGPSLVDKAQFCAIYKKKTISVVIFRNIIMWILLFFLSGIEIIVGEMKDV